MLAALTRAVSPSLTACELTWLPRQPIDIELAIQQHHAYERALSGLGLHIISLPAEPALPDSMFVEDPLLVLDEIAILTRMGAVSRRAEGETLAAAIAPFRALHRLTEPATLEGGDVMRIGRDLYVGLSGRTNEAGIDRLRTAVEPFGYRVIAVRMNGCLHLKSACCFAGDGVLVANPAWLDLAPFCDLEVLPVPDDEPGAANVLRIHDTLLMPACFPKTEALLRSKGFNVQTVDISELIKAEAAVTCSSVIFET
ncbi:MAG: arginine deiminase family protein [Terriglobia bacterium]